RRLAQVGDVQRPKSCSSAPRKIVKGVLQGPMHEVRIVRRQNPLAPALERRRRSSAVLGRDLKGPAEMLARMTESDAQAVVTANIVIKRADIFELLGQGRRGFDDPGFDVTPDLAG